MQMYIQKTIQWIHQLGCVIIGRGVGNLNQGFLGVEHPYPSMSSPEVQDINRELLLLSCPCNRLQRSYYVPWMSQYIPSARELHKCLQDDASAN